MARCVCMMFVGCLMGAGASVAAAQKAVQHNSFEIVTRMEIDVDGAPNAYGPRGKKTLDYLSNARYRAKPGGEIVGYLTDDDHPTVPIVQGPHDPFPGYYVSTTHFVDHARRNRKDPLRYVDATKINYVVLGDEAKRRGARVGDFVAVYSRRHKRAVYGIVGDSGNPSGEEGSLHLLQALGYAFKSGKTGSVERKEIVVRFFPKSNPGRLFFRSQASLDAAAEKMGLSRAFVASSASKR
ncbi:MAG: hypothetical protein ABI147_02910 [Acidobacteriaceae bacterium]